MAASPFTLAPGVDTGNVSSMKVSPSETGGGHILQSERAKASFDTEDLAQLIYGSEHLSRMQRILPLVENEPAFCKKKLHYMSRMERFDFAVKKEKRFAQMIAEHQWTSEDVDVAETLVDVLSVFHLHRAMWMKTIRDQGTEEQHRMFLEPSLSYDIIGCYSQTELGHGSNVQGLETTATWIQESQEFELHSPRLTSAKWWSGGLGTTATHSSVMAQLIINGKRYGPHAFVVPLRDLTTREPLPGRKIGDIGPKMGYNTVDNGYLLLDHVKIPHNHFLAKNSQVDPSTGEYQKPGHDKLSYGTMTYIRAGIVMSSRDVIARAATIAVRYCAVRRQFVDKDAPAQEARQPMETQVLNYQMVQYRLLPLLALAYAFHFTGVEMFKLYESNMTAVRAGDFSLLADVHAFSSALKSYTTIAAASAIEDCRRACGGHGYSMAGGMASQYQDYLPQVTYEGDSYMLTQQVAKYLMTTFRKLSATDFQNLPAGSHVTSTYIAGYLSNRHRKARFRYSGDCGDLDMFIDAFAFRASHMLERLVTLRDVDGRPWNTLLVDMFKVSRAHAEFHLIWNFAAALRSNTDLRGNAALRSVLHMVFELFACNTMDREIGDFLKSGYMSPEQAELIRSQLDSLLARVRPQAIPLVESFKIPDYLLNSALGRQDGEVYQALFDFARAEPLNSVVWNPDINATESRMPTAISAKL